MILQIVAFAAFALISAESTALLSCGSACGAARKYPMPIYGKTRPQPAQPTPAPVIEPKK